MKRVALLLVVLAVFVTWPQATHPYSVNDFGDPLLNSWILAWDAHALHAQPLALFAANSFHPVTDALAFSEPMLLPGMLLAPLAWMGANPIVVHNLLLVASYVLSGLAMFALARELTGDELAAAVAAVLFACYPYRTEFIGKVQMELVWWTPMALLAVHRLLHRRDWRYGAWCGLALAAQLYTTVYLGVFAGVFVAHVALVMTLRPAGRSAQAWIGLGAAAAVVIVLAVPLARAFSSASTVVGERQLSEVTAFSAAPADYLHANPDNWLYGNPRDLGEPERRLFPGYTGPALALVGLISPVNAGAAAAYAIAGIASVDLSLGTNAPGYRWLYEHVRVFRALRVPARFGMMLGLAIAVLASLGTARLLRGKPFRTRAIVATVLIMAAALEGKNRALDLSRLDDLRPAVYEWLARQPRGVVCEYPVGNLEGRIGPQDATYEYYATRHWMPLVNGYSGFEPSSYVDLKAHLRGFPDDAAIDYLRTRQVTYLLVHSVFYIQGDYARDVDRLRENPGLTYVQSFPWIGGGETAVFLIKNAAGARVQ